MGEQLGLERARSILELARQLGSRPILELAGSELAGSALELARQLGGAGELGRTSRWIKQQRRADRWRTGRPER